MPGDEFDKNVYRSSPRLAGGGKILSTMPTGAWVMLGSGGFDKGWLTWQPLTARLQTHLAAGQESI